MLVNPSGKGWCNLYSDQPADAIEKGSCWRHRVQPANQEKALPVTYEDPNKKVLRIFYREKQERLKAFGKESGL